jgi:hypothetical protein
LVIGSEIAIRDTWGNEDDGMLPGGIFEQAAKQLGVGRRVFENVRFRGQLYAAATVELLEQVENNSGARWKKPDRSDCAIRAPNTDRAAKGQTSRSFCKPNLGAPFDLLVHILPLAVRMDESHRP